MGFSQIAHINAFKKYTTYDSPYLEIVLELEN